jgi:phospholipid/cholesterol/gamma-HCH transport system ATP-binding protein
LSAPFNPSGDDGPPIVVEGLVNSFAEHVVHENLDLTVDRGEVMGLVGGSGAGKTVLLNTIIGLRRPDAGRVMVFGKDLTEADAEDFEEIERRWGVMFQTGALWSSLTVRENVGAPILEHTTMGTHLADLIADLKLSLVGLSPAVGDLKPSELSGGMRKRVGLARALALDPELLFLDEPTAGLDPIGAAAFDVLIRDLATNLGLTVFLVTHDLDSLYAVCDRVAVIADKKIVAHAPIAELEKSSHPWIREYFLGPRGRAAAAAKETN